MFQNISMGETTSYKKWYQYSHSHSHHIHMVSISDISHTTQWTENSFRTLWQMLFAPDLPRENVLSLVARTPQLGKTLHPGQIKTPAMELRPTRYSKKWPLSIYYVTSDTVSSTRTHFLTSILITLVYFYFSDNNTTIILDRHSAPEFIPSLHMNDGHIKYTQTDQSRTS